MDSYLILAVDGWKSVDGHIVKLGKGKSARPALGIQAGRHSITHLASGCGISPAYLFLSQARVVANQLLILAGERLLEDSFELTEAGRLYLCESWGSVKQPPTFEEWINGPDYDTAVRYASDKQLPPGATRQHIEQLPEGDISLVGVPATGEAERGVDVAALFAGRHPRR